MSKVVYESTLLMGTNKAGKLRCDPDGYYDVALGGFDTYNSGGAYYDFASARGHFDSDHEFMRRIQNRALYGELGHPDPIPGMSKVDWITRIIQTDPKNISHHIKSVELDDTTFKNRDGKPQVTVFGRIKPAGPHAQSMGESMDNPDENIAFSIRSLTQDKFDPYRGCMVKKMVKIVTFDRVIEPGIATSVKLLHPSLESLAVDEFNLETIDTAIVRAGELYSGMECKQLQDALRSIRTGVVTQSQAAVLGAARLPRSARWV